MFDRKSNINQQASEHSTCSHNSNSISLIRLYKSWFEFTRIHKRNNQIFMHLLYKIILKFLMELQV